MVYFFRVWSWNEVSIDTRCNLQVLQGRVMSSVCLHKNAS